MKLPQGGHQRQLPPLPPVVACAPGPAVSVLGAGKSSKNQSERGVGGSPVIRHSQAFFAWAWDALLAVSEACSVIHRNVVLTEASRSSSSRHTPPFCSRLAVLALLHGPRHAGQWADVLGVRGGVELACPSLS